MKQLLEGNLPVPRGLGEGAGGGEGEGGGGEEEATGEGGQLVVQLVLMEVGGKAGKGRLEKAQCL